MEYNLLALFPPSNIESVLGEIQTRFFSEAGITSALALPVLLPLCYLPSTTSKQASRFFKQILKEVDSATTGFSVTSLDIIAVNEPLPGTPAGDKRQQPLARTSIFYQVGLSGPGVTILRAIKAAGQKANEQRDTTAAVSAAVPSIMEPLPLFEFGFFLGQEWQEAGNIPEKRLKRLKELFKPLPVFHFSLFTYELFRMRTADLPRFWYQEVFWEVIEQYKVRRAR